MLTLTATDLERLQSAQSVLLSPLSFGSVDDWRLAACRAVQSLLQADKAGFLLPLDGETLLVGEQLDMDGFRAYAEYFWTLDVGFQQRRKELQLEVNNLEMVYDKAALRTTEVYNDFSRRYGFLDALAASSDVDPSSAPATVVVYHERESRPEFGARGIALMSMLLPALKAGATVCTQYHGRRANLFRFVDSLSDPCLVVDAQRHVVHQTPAMTNLLRDEPERTRLRAECLALADGAPGAIARKGRPEIVLDGLGRRSVRTGRGTYGLNASLLGAHGRDAERLVLVTVTRSVPARRAAADARQEFRLTPRQVQVAYLLADGHTDAQIAAHLGVSIHTAQRHTEAVLFKLGVHSRAAVGARLLAT